ncbi:MAG: ABC transporter substrate-binding protein [Tepidisphaerales bacterium]
MIQRTCSVTKWLAAFLFVVSFWVLVLSAQDAAPAAPDAPPGAGSEEPNTFDALADKALLAMTKRAEELKIKGVAVVAYIEGDSVKGWSSKMAVVGSLKNAPTDKDRGSNLLGIAYAKAAEMADTLKDSGSAGRPPMTGEFGWKGGLIAKVKTGYAIAAFSGGPSEDDLKVSRAGLDVLAAIGQSAKPLVVGFSQLGAASAWRTAQTESIRSEAIKRGIDLRFADAQHKQENQIKAVRSFIAQRVDVIVLTPVVASGLEPVLNEVKEAKIPVLVLDREIDTQDPTLCATVIAPDMVEEGRKAAKWLARRMNGKGSVVELQGVPGSGPAIDRHHGFAEVLKDYPDLQVVKSGAADFTRDEGKKLMEGFLQSGDRIDAVFAHNDDMALGAIAAIEEAGKKPGVDIIIVSIDGVKAALEAAIAGKLGCTVEFSPAVGPLVFDTVEKLMAGKTVPRKITVEDRVFDQKAAKEAIGSRKY